MEEQTRVLEYKCPCCNAGLHFGSDAQKLTCEYCGNTFDIDTVRAFNESQDPQGGGCQLPPLHEYHHTITSYISYSILPKTMLCLRKKLQEVQIWSGWTKSWPGPDGGPGGR